MFVDFFTYQAIDRVYSPRLGRQSWKAHGQCEKEAPMCEACWRRLVHTSPQRFKTYQWTAVRRRIATRKDRPSEEPLPGRGIHGSRPTEGHQARITGVCDARPQSVGKNARGRASNGSWTQARRDGRRYQSTPHRPTHYTKYEIFFHRKH